jgi:hypothetical protein
MCFTLAADPDASVAAEAVEALAKLFADKSLLPATSRSRTTRRPKACALARCGICSAGTTTPREAARRARRNVIACVRKARARAAVCTGA